MGEGLRRAPTRQPRRLGFRLSRNRARSGQTATRARRAVPITWRDLGRRMACARDARERADRALCCAPGGQRVVPSGDELIQVAKALYELSMAKPSRERF